MYIRMRNLTITRHYIYVAIVRRSASKYIRSYSICHCLSRVPAIRNLLFKRHYSLYSSAMLSSSPLVKAVYSSSSFLPFTFTGYNFIFGSRHIKLYSDHDFLNASFIYNIRKSFGLNSPFESIITDLSRY